MPKLAAGNWVVCPPADRPAGKRGLRGPLAALVAIAAFYPYALSQFGDEPSWGKPVWLAAAAALIAAAVLLWTGRRAVTLAPDVCLTPIGPVMVAIPYMLYSSREGSEKRWMNVKA